MRCDSAVIGLSSGIVGGLVFHVFIWMFYVVLGIADVTPSLLGAYIAIKPGPEIATLSAQAIGMVVQFDY